MLRTSLAIAVAGRTEQWTDRIILHTGVGCNTPPAWLISAYQVFRNNVADPAYPCYFGTAAELHGELYYAFISARQEGTFFDVLVKFVSLAQEAQRNKERRNLVVFCEPEAKAQTHDYYRTQLWSLLQNVHDKDPCHEVNSSAPTPDYPLWEFPFMGMLFFVVGAAPSYISRKSRNLGPGLIMIFQPRDVFIDQHTGEPISGKVRQVIRQRSESWDGIGIHPDLGIYSHTSNREWKQYFLTDDSSEERRECPFHTRPSGKRS